MTTLGYWSALLLGVAGVWLAWWLERAMRRAVDSERVSRDWLVNYAAREARRAHDDVEAEVAR